MLGSAARQRSGQLIGQSKLSAVPMRLLEVMADDLFVFEEPFSGDAFQPGGESSVQICALLLGERSVGGVAIALDHFHAAPVSVKFVGQNAR